jgi:putative (di)nucleoside polyphosphate hydrolase
MSDKPYRPNVGVALFNAHGRVLIAHRIRNDGPEVIYPGAEWQMPQGGIDGSEDPQAAAIRELYEETGVTDSDYLGQTDWLTYEFPPYLGLPHKLAQFRGQKQMWFARRFTGDERMIDPLSSRNGEEPEFDQWRWEELAKTPALVVPYKRDVYLRVAEFFSGFATPV